jgi:hypothetical protein
MTQAIRGALAKATRTSRPHNGEIDWHRTIRESLLALSDHGTPCYDEKLAGQMSALGVPSFACTPDLFPELMATAIRKGDIAAWAARHEIITR